MAVGHRISGRSATQIAKNGEYHTHYKLLAKNQVKLRFTRVMSAVNLYPGLLNETSIKEIKGKGFLSDSFLDELLKNYNPDDYNPDEAAQVIFDEFLQELLERRSTTEFKNIVFSIQKKQGEIIQASYNRNMVVQGCAGSGKSMIMLHRLPILLYDHPDSLSRTSLYIITPSQMYVQLTENMRHQLEISDLNMGTIEEYYDLCISRYPGHNVKEYGKIDYSRKLSEESEKYVYSEKCINDIKGFFEELTHTERTSLDKALRDLQLRTLSEREGRTYAQVIYNRILSLQRVLNANSDIINKYLKCIQNILDAMTDLSTMLVNRKTDALRITRRTITRQQEEIKNAQRDLDEENPNRREIIANAKNEIISLETRLNNIDGDDGYFKSLADINAKIIPVINLFKRSRYQFISDEAKDYYDMIDNIGMLIGTYHMISWDCSRVQDKYGSFLGTIDEAVAGIGRAVSTIQSIPDKYLEFEYYKRIHDEVDTLSNASSFAIKKAYELIMDKIGIKPSPNGDIKALRCSPYIYLQVLYLFNGEHLSSKESLLAIDEVQSMAPTEIQLLKNVNGGSVVFNLFGDVNQHIEGTKGFDSWNELASIIDFDYYEMQENYRNASQITEYCKQQFDMNMVPINTPGKGVHEMNDADEFRKEMLTQLMDNQRAGLAAILVSNAAEARYLMNEFSAYNQKFHDMTDEDFSIHHTRWNIITIDDAKGIEFSSVFVLAGRMSRNQRYIAYTRALDDLYVYTNPVDITGFEKKPRKRKEDTDESESQRSNRGMASEKAGGSHKQNSKKGDNQFLNSEVRKFFEESGLEVVDNRATSGRLWVIGEKVAIRDIVNQAINQFSISGKYTSNKEINNKPGWYTKTEK